MIRRSFIRVFVPLMALGNLLGCSAQPRDEMEALALRFGEHGVEALRGSVSLQRIGEGFEAAAIPEEIAYRDVVE